MRLVGAGTWRRPTWQETGYGIDGVVCCGDGPELGVACFLAEYMESILTDRGAWGLVGVRPVAGTPEQLAAVGWAPGRQYALGGGQLWVLEPGDTRPHDGFQSLGPLTYQPRGIPFHEHYDEWSGTFSLLPYTVLWEVEGLAERLVKIRSMRISRRERLDRVPECCGEAPEEHVDPVLGLDDVDHGDDDCVGDRLTDAVVRVLRESDVLQTDDVLAMCGNLSQFTAFTQRRVISSRPAAPGRSGRITVNAFIDPARLALGIGRPELTTPDWDTAGPGTPAAANRVRRLIEDRIGRGQP